MPDLRTRVSKHDDEALQLMRDAAEAAGNPQATRAYHTKLQTLTANRDTERPEQAHTKAFQALR